MYIKYIYFFYIRGLKNYTLRGGEGKEKGLILRAYEELINNLKFQEQNYTVSIESWVIYQENIIDLLSEESGEAQISKNKELLLTKVEISSLGELKNAYDSNHFKMNKLSTQMKDPRLKEISHYLFSIVLSEASSKQSTNDKKLTFIRFGSISSSHELKSLQKFINTFPDINKKSHKTLLTYYLSEFNLKNLVILDVLSPNTSPKQLKQCLLNTRVNISNKPEKPPISPTYKDLLKKTPDNANFTKERIREKEGQLDKDFSNLIDRYNHSKSLIDNLGKKKSPIFSTTAKKNNEFMTLEKDILRLKSHIVEKLEATSPPNLNSSQKANLNSNVKKEEFSQAKGSLKKLKGVFEEKEAILVEKCDNLKRVNEDLKENLRLYMEKKDLLEEEVRGKDSLIEEYVGHLQNYEQSLKEERDAMEDLKEKFEEILREKDALSNKNLEIMRKLEKKTKKIQMLK